MKSGCPAVELPLNILAQILEKEVNGYFSVFMDNANSEANSSIEGGEASSSVINSPIYTTSEVWSGGLNTISKRGNDDRFREESNLKSYTDMCLLVFGQSSKYSCNLKGNNQILPMELSKMKNKSPLSTSVNPNPIETKSSHISNDVNDLVLTNEFLSLLDCVFQICRNKSAPLFSSSLPLSQNRSNPSTSPFHIYDTNKANSDIIEFQLNLFRCASNSFLKVYFHIIFFFNFFLLFFDFF
jgi:hypothetical protein